MYYDRRASVDRRQRQIPVAKERRNGKDRRSGHDRRKGLERRLEYRMEGHDRRAYI